MAKTKAKPALLQFPCSFGGVSIGDRTARIGLTVSRSDLQLAKCDNELCEHRLTLRLQAKPNGEHPDQQHFPGMEAGDELAAIADVKGFSVTADHITLGLTFAIGSIDVGDLAHFAKRSGTLIVDSAEELEEEEEEEEEEE